jgi:hypothetical protein
MIKQSPYPLTQDQIQFFHENGYLHLKNVLSEEECQLLIEEADNHANGHYSNYLNMHYQPYFSLVHRGKTFCDIGDALLKNKAIPIGGTFFFCKPNNPLELGSVWHQDNYGMDCPDGGSVLNIAISLDEADITNGSLSIVPKSHLYGKLPSNPKPNFSYDENGKMYQSAPIGNDCQIPDGLEMINLTYEKGDVLCIHGNLLHKADKNTHPTKWRRTMYYIYVSEGSPFWPGWTARRELLERYDSPLYKNINE